MHTAYIADNEVSFAEKENITEFLKDVGALLWSFPLSVYLFFFNGQYFSKHFSFLLSIFFVFERFLAPCFTEMLMFYC